MHSFSSFAFVTFKTPEEADNAIEGLEGTEFEGKTTRVKRAIRNRKLRIGFSFCLFLS